MRKQMILISQFLKWRCETSMHTLPYLMMIQIIHFLYCRTSLLMVSANEFRLLIS